MANNMELLQVVFEVTYRCASNCLFCYNCWKSTYERKAELSITQIETILNKIPRSKMLALSGGEPLLHSDLEKIIILAKENAPRVSVITSGILIDESIAKMFKKHGVFVQVAIHGLEKTHNALTRVEDGFRKAIRGMAWLKKYNVHFATTTVATNKNSPDFRQIFELGVALGAAQIQVIRFMPGGEGLKHQDLMLRAEDYRKMMQDLNQVCKKYHVCGAMGAPNTPCSFPDSQYSHIFKGSCSAGIDWIAIDPSGRVRFCNHSPTILGSLIEQDFETIWQHPLLQKFREYKIVPSECSGCEKKQSCRGGCRAVAETYFGDIYAPDPLMTCREGGHGG